MNRIENCKGPWAKDVLTLVLKPELVVGLQIEFLCLLGRHSSPLLTPEEYDDLLVSPAHSFGFCILLESFLRDLPMVCTEIDLPSSRVFDFQSCACQTLCDSDCGE